VGILAPQPGWELAAAVEAECCAVAGLLDHVFYDDVSTNLNGDSLSVCTQTDQTKMNSLGLNKWQKDIWPRKLFNLTDNQHLAGLRYYFTDAGGNNKVGYGGGSAPFTYTFKCQ